MTDSFTSWTAADADWTRIPEKKKKCLQPYKMLKCMNQEFKSKNEISLNLVAGSLRNFCNTRVGDVQLASYVRQRREAGATPMKVNYST